jgi:LPXTG-motif cell wall-anchored protein
VTWSITDGASGTGQETDPFTVGTDESVEITFTNTYPSGETDSDGSVRITKQVDGDAPDAPFEFTIDCDDGLADAFLLRDGESVTFTRASEPYNECTITETNRQGADSSYWKLLLPDGSAVEDDADSPPPVTIVADVTRELTYINVFSSNGDPKPDDETTEAPKKPETTEEPPAEQPAETETPTRVEAGTGGQLPSTGLPAQVLALVALGLMLLGIGGLAHTRR